MLQYATIPLFKYTYRDKYLVKRLEKEEILLELVCIKQNSIPAKENSSTNYETNDAKEIHYFPTNKSSKRISFYW
jgi:hypothetical protein